MTEEVHSSSILLTFTCWLLDFNLCLHFSTRLVYTLPLLLSELIFSLSATNILVELYLTFNQRSSHGLSELS
jgi:hypothetical protein